MKSGDFFINVKIVDKRRNQLVYRVVNCDLSTFKKKRMLDDIMDKFE